MNYKQCFIFLIIVQIIYFTPVLFKGEVISPHPNDYEVDNIQVVDNQDLTNRRFSDYSSVYIPELNQHLNGSHHAWISTWNPYVQLGRPTFQLSGLSRAYLITNILSRFTKNPFILYTALIVVTVSLTGIFLFSFLKSLDLHPIACSVSAIGLSLGIFFSYWLTFIMFISTICWSICLLWLSTEFIKKQSLPTALGMSFATYSLLITGYPQLIILFAYIIIPYAIFRLFKRPGTVKQKFFTLLSLLGLAISGLIMALPSFVDLFVNAQRSARLSEVSDDFFLGGLPKIDDIKDLGIFLAAVFDPFWFDNPIKPEYLISDFYAGSLSPLYFTLFILSFSNKQWRKLWAWQIFTIICLLGNIWPTAYLFAVHNLGFHLSRCRLLTGALIPGFILSGYALDSIIKRKLMKPISLIAWGLLPIIVLSTMHLLILLKFSYSVNVKYLIMSWVIVLSLIILIISRKYVLIQALAFVSVLVYGQSMMLVRPIDKIQTSSALVNFIKETTSNGTRYASFGNYMVGTLPPNQEALFQIKSIHSYDSLSSQNYQRIVSKWSESGTITYGRYFHNLDSESKLNNAGFNLSGVSLILSRNILKLPGFIDFNQINDIHIYKSLKPPILLLQTTKYRVEESYNKISLNSSIEPASSFQPEEIVRFDDFLKIKVTPSAQETLLFLSQQYHPQWKASSKNGLLKTIIINDFYQGVIIPPNTKEVNLEFTPYVLWSWLPQLLYVSLGAGLIGIQLIKSTRQVDTLLQ